MYLGSDSVVYISNDVETYKLRVLPGIEINKESSPVELNTAVLNTNLDRVAEYTVEASNAVEVRFSTYFKSLNNSITDILLWKGLLGTGTLTGQVSTNILPAHTLYITIENTVYKVANAVVESLKLANNVNGFIVCNWTLVGFNLEPVENLPNPYIDTTDIPPYIAGKLTVLNLFDIKIATTSLNLEYVNELAVFTKPSIGTVSSVAKILAVDKHIDIRFSTYIRHGYEKQLIIEKFELISSLNNLVPISIFLENLTIHLPAVHLSIPTISTSRVFSESITGRAEVDSDYNYAIRLLIDEEISLENVPETILPPTITRDDTFTGLVNTSVIENVGTNDIKEPGKVYSYELQESPFRGSLVFFSDGSFEYTPNTNFTGLDYFRYNIIDESGTKYLGNVNLIIDPLPQSEGDYGPRAFNGILLVVQDSSANLNLNTIAAEVGIGQHIYTEFVSPNNGVVEITGAIATYTPNIGYYGSDVFQYKVSDSENTSDTAFVFITIAKVNKVPIANPDNFIAIENTTLSGNVSVNDEFTGDGSHTFSLEKSTDNGTLFFNSDGSFSYTPSFNFTGVDKLYYYIIDEDGDRNLSYASITTLKEDLEQGDLFPIAFNFSLEGIQNEPIPVYLYQYSQKTGTGLHTYSISTNPLYGAISNFDESQGTFIYTPNTSFLGEDTLEYTITDSIGITDTATVAFTISAKEELPDMVAITDSFATLVNTEVTGDVSTNDILEENIEYTFALAETTKHGSLVFNSDGTFLYSPSYNFVGIDNFYYTINSDELPSFSLAAVNIIVNTSIPEQGDLFPIAFDYSYFIRNIYSVNILLSSIAAETGNKPHYYEIIKEPTIGTITDWEPSIGAFVYNAPEEGGGLDTIEYKIIDSIGNFDTATLSFDVYTPAVAVNDNIVVSQSEPVTGNLFDNDTLQPLRTYEVELAFLPQVGTLSLDKYTGNFTYIPPPAYIGTDSFSYRILDTYDKSNIATVFLDIQENPNPPVAVDDTFEGFATVAIEGQVDINDLEIGDGPHTYTLIDPPVNGSISFYSTGQFTYIGNAGFNGQDTFTYQITDTSGDFDIGTVTLLIERRATLINPILDLNQVPGFPPVVDFNIFKPALIYLGPNNIKYTVTLSVKTEGYSIKIDKAKVTGELT